MTHTPIYADDGNVKRTIEYTPLDIRQNVRRRTTNINKRRMLKKGLSHLINLDWNTIAKEAVEADGGRTKTRKLF